MPPSILSWLTILRISRPSCWIYLFGSFLLGVLVGYDPVFPPLLWPLFVFGVYFLFPASLLVYGVGDIFDYEQDRLAGKIVLVSPDWFRRLTSIIVFFTIPFLLFVVFLPWWISGTFFLFLFLAVFDSAFPIRAKTKPILGCLFNTYLILPGIFGYYLAGGMDIRWPIYVGAVLWAIAIHAYRAVSTADIDAKTGTHTIATWFGKKITLIICLALFLGATLLVSEFLGFVTRVLGIVYALLIVLSWQQKTTHDFLQIYRWFPIVNMFVSLSLFLIVLVYKLTS